MSDDSNAGARAGSYAGSVPAAARAVRVLPATFATLVLVVGCGGLDEGTGPSTRPSRDDFEAVADVMVASCGTLDCHGQAGRNLSVWGVTGQRLAPDDVTGAGETTAAEYDATYRSIVALEPEALATVVQDGGARPERLLVVRKPRGRDDHTGKIVMIEGDPRDLCLRSWLAGVVDRTVCDEALTAMPVPADGP